MRWRASICANLVFLALLLIYPSAWLLLYMGTLLIRLLTPSGFREAQQELLELDDDVRDVYAHGFTYGSGFMVPDDLAKADEWNRTSAEQGDADAQFVLGYMYDKGLGVPLSHDEAAKWYQKAAKQGQDLALAALGNMYTHGHGVPADYIEAYVWLSRAMSRLPPGRKHILVTRNLEVLTVLMTPDQIAEAESILGATWAQ